MAQSSNARNYTWKGGYAKEALLTVVLINYSLNFCTRSEIVALYDNL